MKKTTFLVLAILLVSLSFSQNNSAVKTTTDKNGYSYKTVENDPFGVREYQLKNGLKVFLSENKEKPEVSTMIAVKAGSTYDPKETTGLAHYLEHLMFKGTSEIATVNWKKEKVLLDQISEKFEEHKAAKTDEEKTKIYAEIDKLSFEAAKYAAPSEYDKMISSIGAKRTNAFTSNERTVYVNTIPSNQLDKWMTIEGERFSELVLRLFHTELETVYEEFNSGQSSDGRQAYYRFNELLFPTHPYGQQTTIGKPEHLKNPSMVNIHKYWEKYYVANNMAIIMTGDLNFEETILKVDKYFGGLRTDKNLKHPTFKEEEPLTKAVKDEVFGPESEFIQIGFRTEGANDDNNIIAELIGMILSNGQAGLIDLELVKSQKVLNAYAYESHNKDYGTFVLSGRPLEGQKLEDLEKLLLNELEKIKKGEFDDWLQEAIINQEKLSRLRQIEYNYYIYSILDAFILDVEWKDQIARLDKMEKISKEQIIDYAKKTFNNNYACVYKRKGENKNIVTVDKPKITAIEIDRTKESDFLKKLKEMPETRLEPEFIDFKEKIKTKQINNIEFNYIKNPNNELTSLNYIFEMGSFNIKELSFALSYFEYVGTEKFRSEELAKEYYKLGVYTGVQAGDDRSYIYLSGLDKNFKTALKLFMHNINNATIDLENYRKYIETVKSERSDELLSKWAISSNARSFAVYGTDNPSKYTLTNKEIDKLDPKRMVSLINNILNYKHYILYYGPNEFEDAIATIKEANKSNSELKELPKEKKFEQLEASGTVYFTEYDMVQSSITLIAKDEKFNPENYPYITMFNEFFGAGLSSIVFQEIRESKGLVYSAYAYLSTPSEKDKSHYLYAALNTQPDKMGDALEAMFDILNKMPDAEKQFEESRKAALIKIESKRYTKTSPFWVYKNNQKLGIDFNIDKLNYNKIKEMSYEDFKVFFNKHISNKKFDIVVMGKKDAIDFDMLKKYGKIVELNKDDLFNY